MSKYSHIIWDWNGTLLDDAAFCLSVVNNMLRRRGLAEIAGIEDYRAIFGFPVIEYYRKAGFDFGKESFDDIAVEWVAAYFGGFRENCGLREGAEAALRAAADRGIRQLILSATQRSRLIEQIGEFGLAGYFNEILGVDDDRAGGKIAVGAEFMAGQNVRRAAMIGDTDHDAEAAKALGADCFLLAGGHQNADRLEASGAVVLRNMDEVIERVVRAA